MMIKLVNVNRASLHELLLDYEDFLRVRHLEQWPFDDPRCRKTREFCRTHLDSAVYREKIQSRSEETIANIAITLIHQEDVLLRGLIEWMKQQFLQQGGIKEEMYRARVEYRSRGGNGAYGVNRSNGVYGSYGVNGTNGVNNNSQLNPSNPSNPSQTSTASTTFQAAAPNFTSTPSPPFRPASQPNPSNKKQ